jgi:hypothetical protein
MPLRFLYSLRDILKEKNICINFYYDNTYIKGFLKELERYSIPDIIVLLPKHLTPYYAFETWIAHPIGNITFNSWSLWYELKQGQMLDYMKLDKTYIDSSFWIDEPYLLDLYKTLPPSYQNMDVLVINSAAFSGQYSKGPEEMDDLCRFLNKSYTVVTTRKVDGIKCTLDADFRIQDIAAIATHCKYVVAIMTGPFNGIFNKQTHASVKKWFPIVGDGTKYIFTGMEYTAISDGNLQPVYDYFNSLLTSV